MSRLRGRQEQPGTAGLRRVDWVRFLVDQDAVRAEAVGVGYRLPVAPLHTSVGRSGASGPGHPVGHAQLDSNSGNTGG